MSLRGGKADMDSQMIIKSWTAEWMTPEFFVGSRFFCGGKPGDLPDGQISDLRTILVQPPLQKYFVSPVGQIISTSSRHPASIGGAFRDRHERGVRDAVDALARRTNALEADGE